MVTSEPDILLLPKTMDIWGRHFDIFDSIEYKVCGPSPHVTFDPELHGGTDPVI